LSNEVINWALEQKIERNAPRKFILVLLANRADDAWECWIRARTLAQESGLSVGQVRKHLQVLEEEDGLIKRIPWQRDDGGQGANGYILGKDARLNPYSFTRRGGGRVRVGGFSPTSTGPTRTRGAKNPQSKPTGKPSNLAAREESRRRSSAKAAETQNGSSKQGETQGPSAPKPLDVDLILHLVTEASRDADAYARQIETIKSRAPRLWRDAAEDAVRRFKELEKPEAVNNRASMDHMTYQYVLQARKKNLPAWLIGPLLPFMDGAKAA
jgi:hypothetical protein